MALAATSAHTGLESVAFAMIESSARLKTVALKSTHAMPTRMATRISISSRTDHAFPGSILASIRKI